MVVLLRQATLVGAVVAMVADRVEAGERELSLLALERVAVARRWDRGRVELRDERTRVA